MGSKQTARTPARLGAAALMVAGWVSAVGLGFPAAADPDSPSGSFAGPGAVGGTGSGSRSGSVGDSGAGGALKTTIDKDGVYTVGTDILPGVYSTAGPVGNGTCYWKRVANPDGAMIDNALSKKPQIVQIEPTDKSFKTDGCQTWQLTPDAAPSAMPGPAAGAQLQGDLAILNGLLAPNGQHLP